MFIRRAVAVAVALIASSDAFSVPNRAALPRVAPARRRVAPLKMSATERVNKSKLQTIVKDKVDEETKVKEDLNLEEPWRGPPCGYFLPVEKKTAARGTVVFRRRLLLHNDDVHTFEYVTFMLQKIIPTISNAKAYSLTMTTHCEGVSTVGPRRDAGFFPPRDAPSSALSRAQVSQTAKPLAQKYCVQLQKGGLTASISPDSNFKNNRSGGEDGDGGDDGPSTE